VLTTRLRRVAFVLALVLVVVLCLVSTTAAAILLGTTLATVLLDMLGDRTRKPQASDSETQLRVDLSRRRTPRERATRRRRHR
jgi:hypothetical protein